MSKHASITLLNKSHDVFFILRGIWLLVLFDILALIAFLLVPQGTDVLLSVAEDAAYFFTTDARIMPLFWLLLTLFFWSVVSEYCTRFLIYISDNSGRSLSPVRVQVRRKIQRLISNTTLFFPSGLMILAFLKALFANVKDFASSEITTSIVIIILLIFLQGALLYKLYIGNLITRIAKRYPRLRWLAISPQEAQWVNRLYGIFNDVRVDIPASNLQFTGEDLPRETLLPNGVILPKAFEAYKGNPYHELSLNTWMFRIPVTFYRCLLRQLFILCLISIAIIIGFSFLLPLETYMFIGATALICLALACWQVIYVVFAFIDKAQSYIPIRLILLIIFCITTVINDDHPVRKLPSGTHTKAKSLQHHFYDWFAHINGDSIRSYRVGATKDTVPVVFIAAEGGALRTGAFTAMMLAKLQDTFPALQKHIYCYSGVSGGALGSSFFNSLVLSNKKYGNDVRYTSATKEFFKTDFLAAVTGKLVFAEVINYFIPWHIKRLDRAIALEQAWEQGWHTMQGENSDKVNVLQLPFDSTRGEHLPAIFINTTEVETGLQCVYSNVRLNGSIPLGADRDLSDRTTHFLRYSTAINLSTRFPLVSPGAAFFYNDTVRRHFVDGGYFENRGAETLLEVLKALPLTELPIRPYVIQFNFGQEDSSFQTVKSFNEIMEIIGGIYNTRGGRATVAQDHLKRYVEKDLNGVFINLELTLNTKKFPMNWTLSNTAIDRLDSLVERTVLLKDTIDKKDKGELKKLFVYRISRP